MKTVAGQLVLVMILVIAGGVLWTVGASEQRLAGAERTLATLRYAQAAEELQTAAASNAVERVIADATGTTKRAVESRRTASYWQGDYDQFLQSDDPDQKMLAADASYRAMRAQGGTWQSVTTKLDAIAKRYADVLGQHPENEDAAYNYEFVLRAAHSGCRRASGDRTARSRRDGAHRARSCGRTTRRLGHQKVQDDRADAARRAHGSRAGWPRRAENSQGVARRS